MAFTKEQLRKFAHLIRIEIPDEKLAEMDIDSVVAWLDKLQTIDTTGIKPMITPAIGDAPLRDDVVTVPNIRDSVLANAPDKTGVGRGYFAVPRIMDAD